MSTTSTVSPAMPGVVVPDISINNGLMYLPGVVELASWEEISQLVRETAISKGIDIADIAIFADATGSILKLPSINSWDSFVDSSIYRQASSDVCWTQHRHQMTFDYLEKKPKDKMISRPVADVEAYNELYEDSYSIYPITSIRPGVHDAESMKETMKAAGFAMEEKMVDGAHYEQNGIIFTKHQLEPTPAILPSRLFVIREFLGLNSAPATLPATLIRPSTKPATTTTSTTTTTPVVRRLDVMSDFAAFFKRTSPASTTDVAVDSTTDVAVDSTTVAASTTDVAVDVRRLQPAVTTVAHTSVAPTTVAITTVAPATVAASSTDAATIVAGTKPLQSTNPNVTKPLTRPTGPPKAIVYVDSDRNTLKTMNMELAFDVELLLRIVYTSEEPERHAQLVHDYCEHETHVDSCRSVFCGVPQKKSKLVPMLIVTAVVAAAVAFVYKMKTKKHTKPAIVTPADIEAQADNSDMADDVVHYSVPEHLENNEQYVSAPQSVVSGAERSVYVSASASEEFPEEQMISADNYEQPSAPVATPDATPTQN